jgi:hypothetical protein
MSISSEAIKSALLKKGFELDTGKGRDHDTYFYVYAGKRQPVWTKFSRGSGYKTIGHSLLSQIRKQIKLTAKQFGQFVECPLTREDYAKVLISQDIFPEEPI